MEMGRYTDTAPELYTSEEGDGTDTKPGSVGWRIQWAGNVKQRWYIAWISEWGSSEGALWYAKEAMRRRDDAATWLSYKPADFVQAVRDNKYTKRELEAMVLRAPLGSPGGAGEAIDAIAQALGYEVPA